MLRLKPQLQLFNIILTPTELAQNYGELRERSIRSVMVGPLLYQKEPGGTLNLSATEAGAFTPEHGQIANRLAIALRQADLYEQIQPHAAELEVRGVDWVRELSALYEVPALTSQAVELPGMLAQALKQILAAVHSEVGLIWLSANEPQRQFHLVAQQGLSCLELSRVKDEATLQPAEMISP